MADQFGEDGAGEFLPVLDCVDDVQGGFGGVALGCVQDVSEEGEYVVLWLFVGVDAVGVQFAVEFFRQSGLVHRQGEEFRREFQHNSQPFNVQQSNRFVCPFIERCEELLPEVLNERMYKFTGIFDENLRNMGQMVAESYCGLIEDEIDIDRLHQFLMYASLNDFLIQLLEEVASDAHLGLQHNIAHLGEFPQEKVDFSLHAAVEEVRQQGVDLNHQVLVEVVAEQFLPAEETHHQHHHAFETDRQHADQEVVEGGGGAGLQLQGGQQGGDRTFYYLVVGF